MTHFLPSPPSTAILISTIDLPWHHLQWVISQPQSVKAVVHLLVYARTHTPHTHTLKHIDNHSLLLPTHACRHARTHTHALSCVSRHVHTHMPWYYHTHTCRHNSFNKTKLSALHLYVYDDPHSPWLALWQRGVIPPAQKMKPSRYCLIGFCLFKVSGSLQEFIWSVAENETATLFPRLIILIPLSFLLSFSFFVCLQSVPFWEIKIIRLALKWDQGGPIFTQEVILFLLSAISFLSSACTLPFFYHLHSPFFPRNHPYLLCIHQWFFFHSPSSTNFLFSFPLSHFYSVSITFVSSLQPPTPTHPHF